MRTKLIREVKAALETMCLKPWEIRNGRRHTLILIDGKIIGAVTRDPKDGKDAKNIIANIRKANRA